MMRMYSSFYPNWNN